MCGPGLPAVLLAGSGPLDAETRKLRERLARHGTMIIQAGSEPDAELGWPPLPGLGSLGEGLLATVRGQQLALHTALARGRNPDRPAVSVPVG
jgi:glucosamine--fructose-6-phosphate aminotransferase (isomerizing)